MNNNEQPNNQTQPNKPAQPNRPTQPNKPANKPNRAPLLRGARKPAQLSPTRQRIKASPVTAPPQQQKQRAPITGTLPPANTERPRKKKSQPAQDTAGKQARQGTPKQDTQKQDGTPKQAHKRTNVQGGPRQPTQAAKAKKPQSPRLRVIPLGGLDEVGKNMTVVEYEDDILIVDCGSTFPSDDMLGVDLVIQDISYLQENRSKIRGMLITHGHEDHIGSIPYVLKQLGGAPVPIYGTRLTLALIAHKLKEHRIAAGADLRTVKAGETIKPGIFEVEFIHVNHSIIDSLAFAIKTPVGIIIFTGDFKIDYTPIDDHVIDLQRFGELGRRGVLALFMDSTNVERPGYTMSERTVGKAFEGLFPQAQGRIIIAMFSSNLHRVQQVIDAAVRFGRMVCLTGRSMLNYSTVARDLGLLKIPEGRLVDVDDLDRFPDEELVIITTGSQGENMAGLSRMAFDEHRKLTIRESDMVVLSATPISGNEKSVSRVVNQLFHKGAHVVYESFAEVHVSGHACQEELKLMHALIQPKFFVPVHGEYRMLKRHADLSRLMGMPQSHIALASIGDVIEFTRGSMRIAGHVPAGQMLVDGSGIGDVGNVVLRDRKLLSQDGLIVLVMPIDIGTGELQGEPEIVSRGFVYVRESEELMEAIRKTTKAAVERCQVNRSVDLNNIKNAVRDDVRDLLNKRTKRAPMILPVIVETGMSPANGLAEVYASHPATM